MRISEVENIRWKAGGLPYYRDGQQIWVCLVKSTDPRYNGPDPCIPKGGPDFGETPEQCGMREVEEETGIAPSAYTKTFLVSKEMVKGLESQYQMFVFGFECSKQEAISPNEECIPKWYTAEQAMQVCRRSHKPFLQQLLSMLGE